MLPEIDVKMMLPKSPNDPRLPSFLSDVNWMKDERNGGRKDRRIELVEVCRRGMVET